MFIVLIFITSLMQMICKCDIEDFVWSVIIARIAIVALKNTKQAMLFNLSDMINKLINWGMLVVSSFMRQKWGLTMIRLDGQWICFNICWRKLISFFDQKLQSRHYCVQLYPIRYTLVFCCVVLCSDTGPRLNIKTVLSKYGDFHVKDKTAVRTSCL